MSININSKIKKISVKNILFPSIVLAVIVLSMIFLPFRNVFTPREIHNIWQQKETIDYNEYVKVTFDKLYYSGYNIRPVRNHTYGYYYTLKNGNCIFVLLPVKDSPKETLNDYTLCGKIVESNSKKSLNTLKISLAKDLKWSSAGLDSVTCDFIVSNADYFPLFYLILFIMLCFGGLLSLSFIIKHFVHYRSPYLFPVCPHTNNKERKHLILHAEAELNSGKVTRFNDLYITKNYIVELGTFNVVIIPINKIIWAYCLGTINYKVNHKKPLYNVFLVLKSGEHIAFMNKSSEDSRLALDELYKANSNIIIGYTDAKRREAKKLINRHI